MSNLIRRPKFKSYVADLFFNAAIPALSVRFTFENEISNSVSIANLGAGQYRLTFHGGTGVTPGKTVIEAPSSNAAGGGNKVLFGVLGIGSGVQDGWLWIDHISATEIDVRFEDTSFLPWDPGTDMYFPLILRVYP